MYSNPHIALLSRGLYITPNKTEIEKRKKTLTEAVKIAIIECNIYRKGISILMDPDPASILIALFFLFLTLLFQLCDEAFTAIGEVRIRELEEDGNRKARTIRRMTEHEQRFISRIRISTMFCGIGLAFCMMRLFYTPVYWLVRHAVFEYVGGAITLLTVYLVMAIFATLVFGFICCLMPRRLVSRNPEKAALALAPIFSFFYHLSYPLYGLCAILTYPFVRLVGVKLHDDSEAVTEEDIREMMDMGEEIGAIEGIQKDMVNNIFEFDDITAAEIMTPRIDVTAVDVEDTLPEALKLAVDNGYSRLPVYEEDIDHIIGILYIKDLLPYVGRSLPKNVTIRILLRDTHFVPDTKKCDELFEEMNAKHLQMAIVVDEYGGVAGIVTIEDLLESIVGNMQDEFDNEEEEITQLDEDSFEIDGTLSVSELEELLDTELPEGDYDTVAGFVLDQLGHIPEEGEVAAVQFENLTFTVKEMDDLRIENILVERTPETDTENEDS